MGVNGSLLLPACSPAQIRAIMPPLLHAAALAKAPGSRSDKGMASVMRHQPVAGFAGSEAFLRLPCLPVQPGGLTEEYRSYGARHQGCRVPTKREIGSFSPQKAGRPKVGTVNRRVASIGFAIRQPLALQISQSQVQKLQQLCFWRAKGCNGIGQKLIKYRQKMAFSPSLSGLF